MRTYAELMRNRSIWRIVLVAMTLRVPMFAAYIVLTLHIVTDLHRSYAEAGAVEMVYSLALAVSSPWRGRRLDRVGLRATIAPSLVVLTICWCIAPWVGYWTLLGLVTIGGLFTVPSFSIVRQAMIAAVPDRQRTSVLSLDAVFTELNFMIGPVLGVLLATYIDPRIALLMCQLATVAGASVLFVSNPSLGKHESAHAEHRHRVADWLTPRVMMVLAVAITTTVVLTSEDLGTVAAMRHMGQTTAIGWVLALWGLGSAIGGIVYGGLRRHPPSALLLVVLACSTALVALAPGMLSFALLLLLSGLFCAPTITATVDELTRSTSPAVRGEAMGWHGSALTLGGAAASPVAGYLIDSGGWAASFAGIGLAGLAVALVGLAMTMVPARRRSRGGVDLEGGEDLTGRPAAVERVEVQPGGTSVE